MRCHQICSLMPYLHKLIIASLACTLASIALSFVSQEYITRELSLGLLPCCACSPSRLDPCLILCAMSLLFDLEKHYHPSMKHLAQSSSEASSGSCTRVIGLWECRIPLTSIDRLYGLTVHQTFRYFRMYPGDPRFLKATVRTCYSEYLSSRFLSKLKVSLLLSVSYIVWHLSVSFRVQYFSSLTDTLHTVECFHIKYVSIN